MKDHLLALLQSTPDAQGKRNLAREYLQARILQSLQRCGAMIPLAFQGGTALRFLFSIPRFSEDLDFTLERPSGVYDFPGYLRTIESDLTAEGYTPQIKYSDQRVVHAAFVRFAGLPYESGFSSQPGEILAVKIEVDTHPPAGAVLQTSLVRRHITLRLQHHDRASLLAGKIHALLQRDYTKGRDLYDLLWYLSDPRWPEPNLRLLTEALGQTGWDGVQPTAANWRSLVKERLVRLDWRAAVEDVRPFLENPGEVEWLTLDHLVALLENPSRPK